MNTTTWLGTGLTWVGIVLSSGCAGSEAPEDFDPGSTSGAAGAANQTAVSGSTGGASTGASGTSATGSTGQVEPGSSGGATSGTGTPGSPSSGASTAGLQPSTGGPDGGAQSTGGDTDGGSEEAGIPSQGGTTGSSFPPVSDLTAQGPFSAMSEAGASGYTVFFPEPLGEDGKKHPIATWGNGATTVPGLFALLPHLASHGFVIVASDNPFVTGEELRAGIDWLFAENEREGSRFAGKLDTTNVASFGYSLGSLGTFEIADDPRLTTTVHISGGAMDKSVVPNLRNPAAFFCGNAGDIAFENCESDFELAEVPVFYGAFPGEHLGILASHTTQINEVVTGWFRWRLMHDDTLASMFVGPDCGVCQDPEWTVKQKDFDSAP